MSVRPKRLRLTRAVCTFSIAVAAAAAIQVSLGRPTFILHRTLFVSIVVVDCPHGSGGGSGSDAGGVAYSIWPYAPGLQDDIAAQVYSPKI